MIPALLRWEMAAEYERSRAEATVPARNATGETLDAGLSAYAGLTWERRLCPVACEIAFGAFDALADEAISRTLALG